MLYAITIPLVIIAIAAVLISDFVRRKRKLERYVRESFGKMRTHPSEPLERLEAVQTYYEYEKKNIPDVMRVDDITWNDLDMDTIFALADHTDSFAGESCLYYKLHDLSKSSEELETFEEKVSYFDENEPVRSQVRKSLCLLGKSYAGYDFPLSIDSIDSYRLKYAWVYYLLLGLLLLSAAAAAVFRTPVALFGCLMVYLFNMTVHIIKKATMDIKIRAIFNVCQTLGTAVNVSDHTKQLSKQTAPDIESVRTVSKRAIALGLKRAGENSDEVSMLSAYLLGPFMLDFIRYDKTVTALCSKKAECMRIFKYLGEIDCAVSTASYRRSLKDCCVPQLTDGKSFMFGQLVHPAISNAVPNDFEFRRGVILTGSNASGKSTFIKAAAINLILAQTIHTCTTESAVVARCGVITSMAVKDDVLSGESYYIREIKYLKRMTELCSQGSLLFLAIDEILKGTNTKERIAASKAVLDYFSKQHCMLMVATHDLELAKAFDKTYDNYHFAEVIGTQDVCFDYELHKGISNSSNAIKLLSAIGFPKQIIDMAQSEAEKDTV